MNSKGFDTLAVHAGQEAPDPATGSRAVPIYQTSSYVFRDTEHAASLFALREFGNIYSRIMNPTNDVFERRMAALEGGTGALALSSGQAAIFYALLGVTRLGEEIVSADTLYGGPFQLFNHTLPKLGRRVSHDDSTLDVPDFEAIAKTAHRAGMPFIVDNTVGVGLVKPIEYGADIVVVSATKYVGGHGTSIGGVIVDSGRFPWDNGMFPEFTDPSPSYHGIRFFEAFGNVPGMGNIAYILKLRVELLRDLGACMSPFNAFLFLQGLETLPLRMRRHSENAMAVARFL